MCVISFEVLGMRRPIVAVNTLNTDGLNVLFPAVGAGACHEEACMLNKNFVASFVQIGSLKYLPVHLPIVSPVVASLTCKSGGKIPEGAQWLLVEWCGTGCSELAAWFERHGQAVWRMCCPEHDVRKAADREQALQIVVQALRKKMRIFIWFAFDCIVWTPLAGRNHGNQEGADIHEKLVAERLESRKMIVEGFQFYVDVNLEAERLFGKPPTVSQMKVYGAFVWPMASIGWQQTFMQRWHAAFPCTIFADGCMMGIVGRHGLPLQRRWKIKTDFYPVVRVFGKFLCHKVHTHDGSGERTFGKASFYNACVAETVGTAILESRWDEQDRQVDFVEVVQLQDFQSLWVLCSGCGYSKLRDFPCPWPQCKIQVSLTALSEDLKSTRQFAQQSQQ